MIQPETIDKKPNKCCTDLDYEYGDAVEWEVWSCDKCDESYVVDIEIVRDFKNMEQVK
jgi:hypothetical protein